jgi:ankyrin repeat protein
MADVTEKMRREFINAAWNGQVDKLEETLAEYPDAVHWRLPGRGATALIHAVASGSLAEKAFPFLVEKGSDINARDDNGWTGLMCAADNGGEDMAEKLLALGADTALCNNEGLTAAAVAGKKDTIWARNVAKMILAHEFNMAEQKRRQEKERAAAMTLSETEQAHSGLSRRIVIRRPLALKR